jgi:hypothetical protein
MFIGCNLLRRGGAKIYQPIGRIVAAICNYSTYTNPTTEESVNVPFVQVDGVPTLGAPVTSIDRYIANDYIGSHVALDIIEAPPCMHLETWKISFYTEATAPPAYSKIYAESIPSTQTQYAVGVDVTSTKLRLGIRENTSTKIGVDSVLDVYDGTVKFIEVERTLSGDVTLKVDGVYELLGSGLVGSYLQATAVSIGAIDTGTIGSDFVGKIWDLTRCGQLIPLNEGAGTDIKDSTGTVVGTLTDPSNDFWDYYLPRTMEPQVGNIYKGGTLIGYRDPVTGVFTPEGATDWELTDDKYLIGDTCVIVPAGFEPVVHKGEFVGHNNVLVTAKV